MAYRIAHPDCQDVFRISVVRTGCATRLCAQNRPPLGQLRRKNRIAPFFSHSYSCPMNATLIATSMAASHSYSDRESTINSVANRRWEAVLSRDAHADRDFVYAVRSTGIYCRPTCSSRRPRRDQVEFFTQPEAAERAGFRACRRCKPQLANDAGNNPAQRIAKQVADLCRAIEMNLDGPVKLESLAAQAGASTHAVLRAFRKTMGITPRQYADAVRLRRLKGHLKKGSDVTTAMYEAGYSSPVVSTNRRHPRWA